MLWGLSWEKNDPWGRPTSSLQVSYLIQNAVLSSQRYMQALKKRIQPGFQNSEKEALFPWYRLIKVQRSGIFVECILLHIEVPAENYRMRTAP